MHAFGKEAFPGSKFLGPDDYTIETLHKMMAPRIASKTSLLLGIFDGDLLVGKLSLLEGDGLFNSLEYSCFIQRSYQGAGIGTAILAQLIYHLKDLLKKHASFPLLYLVSAISQDNLASSTSAQKAGMMKIPSAHLRGSILENMDSNIYYIPLREEAAGLPPVLAHEQS